MDELEFKQALNESAMLLRQNRPGEAEELLLPLYEASPEYPDVLINLSGAFILQRKWDKAVKLLKKATKVHPQNAMLWMNLGAAQLGRLETAGPKQQDLAIEAYQRALQVNPETPNAHYHLGLIYKERGEMIRAAAFFQRALVVDPSDRDARYWLERLNTLNQSALAETGTGGAIYETEVLDVADGDLGEKDRDLDDVIDYGDRGESEDDVEEREEKG